MTEEISGRVRINGIDYPCHPKIEELFKVLHEGRIKTYDEMQELKEEIRKLKSNE
jgi:hypothetical protein